MLALAGPSTPPPPLCDGVLTMPFYLTDVVGWCSRAAQAPAADAVLPDIVAGLSHEVGNALTALPVYLPADPAIPVEGVPAEPRFERAFGVVAERLLNSRNRNLIDDVDGDLVVHHRQRREFHVVGNEQPRGAGRARHGRDQ